MTKKPFKVFSTTAMAAAFAVSAIAPVAAAELPVENTLTISDVIVELDGVNVAIPLEDYLDLLAAEKIAGTQAKYVQSNGVFYSMEDYLDASAAVGDNPTPAQILEFLSNAEDVEQDIEVVEVAYDENGNPIPGEPVEEPGNEVEEALTAATDAVEALPAVADVTVADKAAVAAAAVLVADAKELEADVADLEATLEALSAKIAELEAALEAVSVESVMAINNTTVEVTFDNAVGTVAKEDFVLSNSLVVSDAKVKAGNDKVVVLTTSAQTAATTYALNYKGEPTGKSFVGVASVLTAESVKALNLVEVEVKFNREVSKATAEIISNYEISGIVYNASSKATLQADGKTVILELDTANALTNNKNYNVTVNGVTTADNTSVQRVTKQITTSDTTLPTIEKIEALEGSNAAVLVHFSEPIATAGGVGAFTFTTDANGIPTNLTASVNAEDRRIVTLTNAGGLPVGVVKINYTGGVTDYAGLQALPKYLGEVTTVGQTEVTKLSTVTAIDQNKVRVKFSQAIGTAPTTAFYWNRSGLPGDTGNASDKVTRVDAFTFDVEFNTNALPAAEEVSLFASTAVTDTTGNSISEPVTQNFKVTAVAADVAKLVSAVAKKNNEVTLTFDKAMNATDLASRAKFEIYKDGKLVTANNQGLDSQGHPISAITVQSNATQAVVKGLTLDSGVYTVKVTDVRDTNNNKVTASANFTSINETAPTGKLVQVTDAGTGYDYDHILVHFDQEMDTASLANADNYSITIGTNQKLSEVAGLVSIIPTNGNKSALITLDAPDLVVQTATAVSVRNVKSIAGVQMDTFTATGGTLVAVPNAGSHTAGVIDINSMATKESRVNAKTVSFVLPTQLKTIVKDEFLIGKTSGTGYAPESITFENITKGADIGKTKVTVVADRDYALTQSLDVTTKGGTKATTDLLGRKLLTATKTLTVGQSVASAPEVIHAYVENGNNTNTDIVVDFNKSIVSLTKDDFKLVDSSSANPTEQLTLGTGDSALNAVTTTLSTTTTVLGLASATPKLMISGLTGSQDADGQKLAGGVTIEVDNFYATNARLLNKAGGTTALEVGDSIEVTFNSAIDPTTLVPDLSAIGIGSTATAWDGNTDLKIAAVDNAVVFNEGTPDTLTFAGINLGEFNLGANDIVTADVDGMAVTLKLSADKKTVTITFDTVAAGIDATKIINAKFTPNYADLKNAKGSKVNQDTRLQQTTVTKF